MCVSKQLTDRLIGQSIEVENVYNGGTNVPFTEGLNAWLTEGLNGRLMRGDERTNECCELL